MRLCRPLRLSRKKEWRFKPWVRFPCVFPLHASRCSCPLTRLRISASMLPLPWISRIFDHSTFRCISRSELRFICVWVYYTTSVVRHCAICGTPQCQPDYIPGRSCRLHCYWRLRLVHALHQGHHLKAGWLPRNPYRTTVTTKTDQGQVTKAPAEILYTGFFYLE